MEIYFYCSYEHSSRGFFLTRLEGDALVPAQDGVPEAAEEFLSYDRFRLLWRDLAPRPDKPWRQPERTGAFLGIRELKGRMADGRGGTANLVLLAGLRELALLRRTALAILGDFDAFQTQLFGWLSVGGEWGYEVNGAALRAWMEECGGLTQLRRLVPRDDPAAKLLPFLQRIQPPRLERELLRLAVCTCPWREAAEVLGGGLMWRTRPSCALTEEEFSAAFTGRGAIWALEAAP